MTQVKIFDRTPSGGPAKRGGGGGGGGSGGGGCLRWLRRGKPRPPAPKAPRSMRAPATPGLLRRLACCGACRRTAPRGSAEALTAAPAAAARAAPARSRSAACCSKLRDLCCGPRRKDAATAAAAAAAKAATPTGPPGPKLGARLGGLLRGCGAALLCTACRRPGKWCARCCPLPPEVTAERRRSQARNLARGKSMTSSNKELSKLDAALIEHSGMMRGAIPVLPMPLAWICLVCNVLVPGLGTLSMGLFCLCVGKPRFSASDTVKARVGAFCLDTLVAAAQIFTVLFCLVGWGWSIWWGLIALRLARKHKRIQLAERAAATRPAAITVPAKDVEKGVAVAGPAPAASRR